MQVSTAETTKPNQAVPTMAIPTTSKDISSTLAPRTTQSKVLASIPVILPTLHPATPMPGGKKVLKFCEEGQKSTIEKPCKKFRIPFCRYGKKSTTENPCKPRLEFCKPNQKNTFKNPCEVRWCRFRQRSTQNDPCKKISLRIILKELKGRGSINMKVRRWLWKVKNHTQIMNFHKQLKNNKQILEDIKRVRAKSKRELEKTKQRVSKTHRKLKNAKARSPKKLKSLSSKLRKRNRMHHAKKLRKEWLHMMKSRKGQPKLQNMLGKKLLNIANKLKNMRKSNTPSEYLKHN